MINKNTPKLSKNISQIDQKMFKNQSKIDQKSMKNESPGLWGGVLEGLGGGLGAMLAPRMAKGRKTRFVAHLLAPKLRAKLRPS